MPQNTHCQGEHCVSEHGEVRWLPSLGPHANLLLCHVCFDYYMTWRKARNLEIPQWKDLKVEDIPAELQKFIDVVTE